MWSIWQKSAQALGGLVLAAIAATPQASTISAHPGGINYVDGESFLDGQQIVATSIGKTFLSANQMLSTNRGKAEVLLTPGVFLRIGNHTQIRMISPSLTYAQMELISGEAMLEVDELLKGNDIRILDHGASILVEKAGLYRFTADNPPTAAAITGKVQISYQSRAITLGKGHEVIIAGDLTQRKFDQRKQDDLYAWSNGRSMYNAAASLQSAQSLTANSSYGEYAFGGWDGPGWFWNDMFDSWAWLPFGDMAFFSPFGYGFFGPGAVGYAPLCYAPVNGSWGHWRGQGNWMPIAVNPQHPPTAIATGSPWSNNLARRSVARAFATTGFRTPAGEIVPAGAHVVGSKGFSHVSSGNGGHIASAAGGHFGGWAGGRGFTGSVGAARSGSTSSHSSGGGFSAGGHGGFSGGGHGSGGFGGGGHGGGGGHR